MRVFVFGNGLSIGPTGGRLNMAEITQKLWQWLEDEELRELVENLQNWARPQMVELDPDVHRHDFEVVAGSLDRLGHSLASITSLSNLNLEGARNLLDASDELRRLYRRVVAYVLLQIDSVAQNQDETADQLQWHGLDDMARALTELHNQTELPKHSRVSIYTLNYDSLLLSALLEQTTYVYDGFRSNYLNDPLDPWKNIVLYPLHGSIGIYSDKAGGLRKRRLTEMREDHLLKRWADGEDTGDVPQVVLGDTKDSSILLDPFAAYYDQLNADLALPATQEVIVGGYGFGDRPLNRALARFLAAHESHCLHDWRPHASSCVNEVLESLTSVVPEALAQRIEKDQIVAKDIELPSAQAVRDLIR